MCYRFVVFIRSVAIVAKVIIICVHIQHITITAACILLQLSFAFHQILFLFLFFFASSSILFRLCSLVLIRLFTVPWQFFIAFVNSSVHPFVHPLALIILVGWFHRWFVNIFTGNKISSSSMLSWFKFVMLFFAFVFKFSFVFSVLN